jgi:GLPGLI family protein
MSVFQKKITVVYFILFLFSTQSVLAQKKLKSGVVVYEITDVETNVPELKLMKGTKTTLFFTPEKQKIDVNLNNETIKIQTFYNSRNGEILVYYDFAGQHFKVNSNYEDNHTIKPYVKNISYQRSETKSIAGYQCHKTVITFENEKLIIWVTDKIKVKNPDFQSIFPGLEGFPLEYVRHGENTKMTFKAQTVTQILPDKIFETSDNYKEMSEKEFNERMGGMKFGF